MSKKKKLPNHIERKFFHYNSKTYTSIYEANDETDALARVHDVLRRNGKESYIGQKHTLTPISITEKDCVDAGSLLILRKC